MTDEESAALAQMDRTLAEMTRRLAKRYLQLDLIDPDMDQSNRRGAMRFLVDAARENLAVARALRNDYVRGCT